MFRFYKIVAKKSKRERLGFLAVPCWGTMSFAQKIIEVSLAVIYHPSTSVEAFLVEVV